MHQIAPTIYLAGRVTTLDRAGVSPPQRSQQTPQTPDLPCKYKSLTRAAPK